MIVIIIKYYYKMKIKKYEINNNDFLVKNDSIKLSNLYNILMKSDIERILNDIRNNNIKNYLCDNWKVIYFIILDSSFVLTFNLNELPNIENKILSINRNKKINQLL